MTKASALSAFAIFGFASSSALTLSAALVLRNIQKNPEIRLYPQNLTWPLDLRASFEVPRTETVVVPVATAAPVAKSRRVTSASNSKRKHFSRNTAKTDLIKTSVSSAIAPPQPEMVEVAPVADDATSVLDVWKTLRGRMQHLASAPVPKVQEVTFVTVPETETLSENRDSAAQIVAKIFAPVAVTKKKTLTTQKKKPEPRISTVALFSAIPQSRESKATRALVHQAPVVHVQAEKSDSRNDSGLEPSWDNQIESNGWAVESQPAPVVTHQVDVPSVVNVSPTPVDVTTGSANVSIHGFGNRVSTAAAGSSSNSGYSTPLALMQKSAPNPSPAKGRGESLDKKVNGDYPQGAALTASETRSTDSSNDTRSAESKTRPIFFDAFDPEKVVSPEQVDVHRLAYSGFVTGNEDDDDLAPGLLQLEAVGFFPTLIHQSGVVASYPLLTQHSVGELGVFGNAYIRDMGIVFGEVAPGYRLELSGHAPVTFQKNGVTYFLAINLVPGHVALTLRHLKDGTKVTTRVLVMSGAATYANLGAVAFKAELRGKIVDQNLVDGAEVEVFGTAKFAVTKVAGEFVLRDVPYIAGFPIELRTSRPHPVEDVVSAKSVSEDPEEREASKEKNIFWVSPDETEYRLFHEPGFEQKWISEINSGTPGEAPLSEHAPRFLLSFGALEKFGQLYIRVHHHGDDMGRAPELYPIDENLRVVFQKVGERDPGVPMSSTQIFGVNLTEGFSTVEIVDAGHQVVWSKLFFFSDGARTLAIEQSGQL